MTDYANIKTWKLLEKIMFAEIMPVTSFGAYETHQPIDGLKHPLDLH